MARILPEGFPLPKLRRLSLVNLVLFLFFCILDVLLGVLLDNYVSTDTEAGISIHIPVSKKLKRPLREAVRIVTLALK
jgi:ABC-type Fe3+ transport system permease subunit